MSGPIPMLAAACAGGLALVYGSKAVANHRHHAAHDGEEAKRHSSVEEARRHTIDRQDAAQPSVVPFVPAERSDAKKGRPLYAPAAAKRDVKEGDPDIVDTHGPEHDYDEPDQTRTVGNSEAKKERWEQITKSF